MSCKLSIRGLSSKARVSSVTPYHDDCKTQTLFRAIVQGKIAAVSTKALSIGWATHTDHRKRPKLAWMPRFGSFGSYLGAWSSLFRDSEAPRGQVRAVST